MTELDEIEVTPITTIEEALALIDQGLGGLTERQLVSAFGSSRSSSRRSFTAERHRSRRADPVWPTGVIWAPVCRASGPYERVELGQQRLMNRPIAVPRAAPATTSDG